MDGYEATTPSPYIPTRNALKAVLITTLFFITFLAGIAAFFLRQFVVARSNSSFFSNSFSFISVFGAGVFLATCLLDLLPESLECFGKADQIMKLFKGFPFPELCIAGGFLLVLVIEQTILFANERRWIGGSETDRLLNDHHGESSTTHHSTAISNNPHGSTRHQQQHSHPPQFHVNAMSSSRSADAVADGVAEEGGDSASQVLLVENNNHSHDLGQAHSAIRVLLLVFALSLHAVFEGLSLGMISDVSVLLQVFFALLIHKSIIGFSLGIRIVQSKLRRLVGVLCCVVFAGQVIIGGFLGLAVVDMMSETSKATSDFVSGILQAIACGTFLYITCFEILPHELNNSSHRPAKMFFLLLGFALIAFFVAVFPS